MPRKANIWRPIQFNNGPPQPVASTSVLPPHPGPQNPRVRTTRQVKRAYHAHQAVASTSLGTYIFTGQPDVTPEPVLHAVGRLSPSTPRPTSPSYSERLPPSSPPPNNGHGWSSDFPPSPMPGSGFARYRSTRANQWIKWTEVVIPQLVQPYLQLLHRSHSLGSVNRQFSPTCTCEQERARTLKVMCVHFDGEYVGFLSKPFSVSIQY